METIVEIRLLGPADLERLQNPLSDVFDRPVQAALAKEFLSDDRHYLAAAIDASAIVGFASGVRYLHPDKPPQMFINELGVAPSHRGRGIGKALILAIVAAAREAGCTEAWVLTDDDNPAAMACYAGAGGMPHPVEQVMFEWKLDPP